MQSRCKVGGEAFFDRSHIEFGTEEERRSNGLVTELQLAITTGTRLDFSKDFAHFSHFFTLNNVENVVMSFFFSNFVADFSRL